ncbi:hypothetical protein DFH08DRAFT_1019594 [Mycena albidolilacea]|uniref:Uncharacterized protein n=1 Tax=Mycena albidolilacea TaxID=1033008 RepID=A0AAD6ZRB2_9AGAR|nr:hypothetical protein DFH08DRAFT_1019594 [Mycena albidolilacea]
MEMPPPLMGQIQDLLSQLNNRQLKANLLIESIGVWKYYPIANPEALASQLWSFSRTSMIQICNISSLYDTVLSRAQQDAHESQKLAKVSGSLYEEANAVCAEAACWSDLGRYKQCLSLSIRAQSLLNLCGMASGDANFGIMSTQAEVHKCKSEYSEAWTIQTKILQISTNQSAYGHATALLGLAEIAVSLGVLKYDVQRNIDLARSKSTTLNLKSWIICCDTILADLYLREKDLTAAKRLFKKCLKLATEHSEIKLFCLEQLGNAGS